MTVTYVPSSSWSITKAQLQLLHSDLHQISTRVPLSSDIGKFWAELCFQRARSLQRVAQGTAVWGSASWWRGQHILRSPKRPCESSVKKMSQIWIETRKRKWILRISEVVFELLVEAILRLDQLLLEVHFQTSQVVVGSLQLCEKMKAFNGLKQTKKGSEMNLLFKKINLSSFTLDHFLFCVQLRLQTCYRWPYRLRLCPNVNPFFNILLWNWRNFWRSINPVQNTNMGRWETPILRASYLWLIVMTWDAKGKKFQSILFPFQKSTKFFQKKFRR